MSDCLSYYTTEAVLEGHPDKVCDQIADAVLDAILQADAHAKVAIECLGTGSFLFLAGEIFADAEVDAEGVAHSVYKEIGYADKLTVIRRIQGQSSQLRRAVDSGAAGDQGIMYGFACASEFNYLPYGIYVVNAIAKAIDTLRKRTHIYLPDGKVQATIRDGAIETLVISVQHSPDADVELLRHTVLEKAVTPIVALDRIQRVLFNHHCDFVAGGFANDTGLTGRKIANDTYCGLIRHGGGSFSGKDPSKVDRTGTYMARFVAKSIVANGLAESCTISLAYAFGEAEPVMVHLNTEDRNRDDRLLAFVKDRFDLRPGAIADRLGLRQTKYRPTATYGHFSDPAYPWEQIAAL